MNIGDGREDLIQGWIIQSEQTNNYYFSFMSLWIAFNALCYGLFHQEANQQRADLKKSPRPVLQPGPAKAEVLLKDNKVVIDFKERNLTARIEICEKYSEDIIFNEFATKTQKLYQAELESDQEFRDQVKSFHDAIRKPNGCYILNMSRGDHQGVESWPEKQIESAQSNLLSRFDDIRNLSELKGVLYQVRCNVFHGGKIPGIANDDKIVRAASPVLRRLLELHLRPVRA